MTGLATIMIVGPIVDGLVDAVLVGLAGGLGAAARFVLDGVINKAFRRPTPVGTVVINLTGSLLLGLLAGLLSAGLPDRLHLVLGTGFLGGYTTFSTACYDVVALLRRRRYRAAIRIGFATMVMATLAAFLGFWMGARLL